MNHDHPDADRLTVGCVACVARAEEARWLNAPIRRCRWHCSYLTADYLGADLSFTLDVRVPDGVDPWRVDARYVDITGEAFVMALPDCVSMDATTHALETMEVERVDIGPIIPETHAPTYEQAALL